MNKLEECSYTIQHKSGATHCDADCLSRYPINGPHHFPSHHLFFLHETFNVAAAQLQDPTLSPHIERLHSAGPPLLGMSFVVTCFCTRSHPMMHHFFNLLFTNSSVKMYLPCVIMQWGMLGSRKLLLMSANPIIGLVTKRMLLLMWPHVMPASAIKFLVFPLQVSLNQSQLLPLLKCGALILQVPYPSPPCSSNT